MYKKYKTMLISGRTGTGKSTLLEKYINLCLENNDNYLIIIDPKMVEFHKYKNYERVTYVSKNISSYILSELKKLVSERNETSNKLIIVVDEFYEVAFDKKCNQYFKWLIDNKNKLNIELALATQIDPVFTIKYRKNADVIIKFN